MKSLHSPRGGSPEPPQPTDDLDGLLRTFFQAQLPKPWPVPKPPAPLPLSAGGFAARRRSLPRSRFALAASLLILLIGQLLLSGMASNYLRLTADSDPHKIEARNRPISSHQFRPAPRTKQSEPNAQSASQERSMPGR